MQRPSLMPISEETGILFGISPAFAELSPSQGEVAHALLTRAPLYSLDCSRFLVRLACVRHAASVCSEPGSNSPVKYLKTLILYSRKQEPKSDNPYSIVKEHT